MSTKLKEKANNSATNIKIKKPNEINTTYNAKIENTIKMDSSLKKIYLPAIQKRTMQTIPVSSITRRIRKSQSQSHLRNAYKKTNTFNPNTEKEKILLAKYSLSRINAKINDLSLNYKKLLVEKEDNLNIIKNAICSDDPTYAESISLKIQQLLEEAMKNNVNPKNKMTISTTNYENLKISEDKNLKTEDTKATKDKINKTFVREETDNLNVKVNPINEKEQENEDKKEEQKNSINNELNDNNEKNENENLVKSDNELNNNAEQNNNMEQGNNEEQINNVEQNNNNNEEVKNNEENKDNEDANNNANDNNNNVTNLEIRHKHDYSAETREEDINKLNSINNSHLMNNTTSINNININNSLEEQINSLKEIIEEKDEEKIVKDGEKTIQVESGLFEKSSVPKRVFNILKVKSELSSLKHKLINIQQKIRLKDEEIEELKSRAKMKNIIFQKNMLDSKMIALHKIQTKNKEIEEISLPNKNLLNENLKKKVKYYNEINKTYLADNKDAEEDYIKMKNEYKEKNRNYTNLEAKNNNLKYKYNSLRLNDLKKKVDLENLRNKINQIDHVKEIIENDKQMIEEKKKEIEEAKKMLDKKVDEYNKNKENKENKYQDMNKLQKEMNSKITKQKNDINRLKKEIKDIDRAIYKEIENYHNLNKKDKDLVNQMFINKNKSNYEFLEYLKELEKNEDIKLEEERKNRFKKLNIGTKMNHNIISTIKRRPSKKKEEKISTEDLPILEEKLEYYLNNKGSKEEKKEDEKGDTKEEKKEDEKGDTKEEKKEEKREEKRESRKEEKREDRRKERRKQ